MSFLTYEQSQADGAPIECFKFTGIGETYRYTDADEEITINGETYTPLNIERTAIEVGSIIDSLRTMDFTVPVDCDLAQAYTLIDTPDQLDVEVIRVHRGSDYDTESETIWVGFALYYSVSGRQATIHTGTIFQIALGGDLNTVFCQTVCNHVLYDDRCQVDEASKTTTSTVTVVGDRSITVLDDGVANNALRAGKIINNRTGEKRLVMGNSASVITIAYDFIDIVVGDEVTMIQGCIRSFNECSTKFDNTDHFGGFPYVPTKNPFTGEY